MTTARRRKSAGKSAAPAKTTMADYAMSFDQLGLWMAERAKSKTFQHPQATSLSMLDGAIAAIVAGPVSMMQEEWVCPLLGVDPDDFNHDTETYSAIAARLMRHNAISNTLPTKPRNFEPLFLDSPNGEVDVLPWGMGFYAVMKLHLLIWSRLMSPNAIEHRLLLPILSPCVDTDGRPVLGAPRHSLANPPFAQHARRDISAVVETLRHYWMPTRFAPGK